MTKEKKQISKTFYIPEELATKIEDVARAGDMSASRWIRQLVIKTLDDSKNSK